MTGEARIIELINKQADLVAAGKGGSPQHRQIVNELIGLIDEPLRAAFAGRRTGLEKVGLQYTEMVHDFFVKLLEGSVKGNRGFKTFMDVRKLVATVIQNQMRDALKIAAGRRKHLPGIAFEAQKKQKYWEDRYTVSFLEFLDQIDRWEETGTDEQKLAAQVLRFRYVTGETWARIALQFEIKDQECKAQRELAKKAFGGKL